jgi:hypothetical protein
MRKLRIDIGINNLRNFGRFFFGKWQYLPWHGPFKKKRQINFPITKARLRRLTLHVPNLIVLDATLERYKYGSDSNGVQNIICCCHCWGAK